MKDLIDRQETLKEIEDLANLYPYRIIGDSESYSKYNEAWSDCVDMAESAVLNQLTVEAIPIEWLKEWAKKEDDFFEGTLYASLISTILTDWQLRKEE